MSYKVAIRKNDTGEIRLRTMDWDWYKNGEDGDLWWWTEGNFGCDCNRELEFGRANGDTVDLNDEQCSDGRYSVLYAELPDGTKITIDEPEETNGD